MGIKYWWRFKIKHKCPNCKGKLTQTGFPEVEGFMVTTYYRCDNCGWGTRE